MTSLRSVAVLSLAALLPLLAACGGDVTTPPTPPTPPTAPNPAPAISAVSPREIRSGAGVEAIIVTGSGFVQASVVRLNGSERPTEYRSATELRVKPTAADVTTTGAIAVAVHNPPPGGGTSNTVAVNVVPLVVALGETISVDATGTQRGERQFRIAGAAGDEWIAFLHATGLLDLAVVDSATGQPVATVHAAGSLDTEDLEARSSGRFVLPASGTYRVVVTYQVGSRYRFRIDAVDRAPEEGPASMVLGGAAAGSIGSVGDVDEYTFAGRAGQEMNLLVQLQSGLSAGVAFELLHDTTVVRRVERIRPNASIDDAGTGRFPLPADAEYRVRVSGRAYGNRAAATGRYAFELYPVDRRPESGGEVRLDGPPVEESIERFGDVDEFYVQGTAGQQVVIHHYTPATVGGRLIATLIDEQGTPVVNTLQYGAFHQEGRAYSPRAALPSTATYRLRVQAETWSAPTRGAYAIELYSISPEPEHVPARLSIGESVVGERVDRRGDVDVFTFAGEAGREINVFIGSERTGIPVGMRVPPRSEGPFNFAFSSGAVGLEGASTGRMEMTEGTYTLVVDTYLLGSYSLLVFPIDRRPEGRPTAYVPGDTIAGEPLYPAGDVDEYVFSLDEETEMGVFWENHGQSPHPGTGVYARMVDEGSGRHVWGAASSGEGAVALPAGRYRLTVLNPSAIAGGNYDIPRVPTLNYRFALTPR